MIELNYNKIYYFLPKDGEMGGVGFVQLRRLSGDKIHYRKSNMYSMLSLEHPLYKDEIELESYSDELQEFRNWNRDNGISLCYTDGEYLTERLYEIKDITKFPMSYNFGNEYFVTGPSKGNAYREWQMYLLLEL